MGLSKAEIIERSNSEINFDDYENISAITGDKNVDRHLLQYLKISFAMADSIDIVVSFLMETGVELLLQDIQNALDRNVKVRILTGNYLGITQPSALYLLKDAFGDKIELKFYNDRSRSFHAKAYIFHYENYNEIYVGSSNLSKSALTSGIEWTYKFTDKQDEDNYNRFMDTYNDLYNNHSILVDDEVLKSYADSWQRPAVYKDAMKLPDTPAVDESNVVELIKPRGAQIEALYALNQIRKEGANKSLVLAATGVGKTYISAFDSREYNKILFVAHREEILNQASRSFATVRKSNNIGFFNSNEKSTDRDMIFASVSTLGKDEYLTDKYFKEDEFDYIVIDEFHHAVNDQYKKIIEYFKPKFLLGLTATPDRMDGRDIYELCDYIVPFEINLQQAINRGMLVPFRYYGINDYTVNYDNITMIGGKYKLEELNKGLMIEARYDLIFKNYSKYKTKRAIGFCTSRIHAEAMAEAFSKKGIKAAAVYSGEQGKYALERSEAIEKFEAAEVNVLFTVDMFNEGVDIKEIDLVMMLRPTESPTVFLQQLGRGLRLSNGKEYLTILDFIGNFKKAGIIPFLLSGTTYNRKDAKNKPINEFELPQDCQVDFDFELIDLFKQMANAKEPAKQLIIEEYARIKQELNSVPTRMDLFNLMDDDIYSMASKGSNNIFKNYLEFLKEQGDLTSKEFEIYNSIGREFIINIENTRMSKSYKMPVLKAFIEGSVLEKEIDKNRITNSFRSFYEDGLNYKDISLAASKEEVKKLKDKDFTDLAYKMPVNFLVESGDGFFNLTDDKKLVLNDNLDDLLSNEAFGKHYKDVVEFRTADYFRKRYRGKENE